MTPSRLEKQNCSLVKNECEKKLLTITKVFKLWGTPLGGAFGPLEGSDRVLRRIFGPKM
jgi:hypothetical protein